ncbi:MAG: putative addiction module component family protein [Mucilaginibacter sp.]|nr:putative addiction module component family protein [Mucilaginibacter sp.]
MLYGVQYVSNKNGQITAVQVSIEEWEFIKSKSPDIELNLSLPEWQTELISKRLASIKKNPERVKPIAGLLKELDRIEE